MPTTHLTSDPGDANVHDVRPGMAYFANTGPFGTTCGECRHRGCITSYDRWNKEYEVWEVRTRRTGGCAMYKQIMRKGGLPVDPAWPSCKYFERVSKK